jgi:hypothetical protein
LLIMPQKKQKSILNFLGVKYGWKLGNRTLRSAAPQWNNDKAGTEGMVCLRNLKLKRWGVLTGILIPQGKLEGEGRPERGLGTRRSEAPRASARGILAKASELRCIVLADPFPVPARFSDTSQFPILVVGRAPPPVSLPAGGHSKGTC